MTAPSPPHDRPAREWPIPPMDHGSGWKDTAFTWAMGWLILQRIADGETMKAITADARMPAYCTVFRWMQMVPPFGDAVRMVRARLQAIRRQERDARRALKGPKRKSGRRSSYTDAWAGAVLARIEMGDSMSEVVARPGMPSAKVLYTWLRDRPAFREAFIAACDYRDGWLGFQAELTVEEVFAIGIPAANAKIRGLEARRGRLQPKTYRATGEPWARLAPYLGRGGA